MEKNAKGFEFKKFATPRVIGGIAIVIVVMWALSIIFGSSNGPSSQSTANRPHETETGRETTDGHETTTANQTTAHGTSETAADSATAGDPDTSDAHGTTDSHATATHDASTSDGQGTAAHEKKTADSHEATAASQTGAQHATTTGHGMPATAAAPVHKPTPKGVTFVKATIQPLNYELEERWWGWRPNDIIDLTDNVNNFQMGVLEVTRRTTVALAERISRTGTADAFDENLEQAMNWFMIKASSYWFPSAESKYREGLEELEVYLEKLMEGNATFYTRTDNLIPLLGSFQDLLGSCDENLVKQVNEDGTPVGSFAVDNYFFYSQGVASSMATILEAVHHDFLLTLESRNATELLHHAIVSCQQAAEIDPWIILNRDYSSVFANHRANMAAPVSHAYFFLGQLIRTLST